MPSESMPVWEPFWVEGAVLLDANGVEFWTQNRVPSKALKDGKTFKINGVDVSPLVTRTGYTVQYKKILGGNSGYMLDGSYREDLLSRKTVVTVNAMPLSEKDLQGLYQALYSAPVVELYFFDPWAKAYKTIEATTEETPVKYRGYGGARVIYWTGIALTFTEV